MPLIAAFELMMDPSKNKLYDHPASVYLQDASADPKSNGLDLNDAAKRLANDGIGIYITLYAETFAAAILELSNSIEFQFWDYLRVCW